MKPTLHLLSLVSELGFIIALPLVAFVLVGIKLDRIFNTLPLFIIVSIVVSMILSGLAITRKIRRVQENPNI